jgi:hypothetical protein
MAEPSPRGGETFTLRKRRRYERGFTIADNQLLQDTARLSYRAIGLAVHLWSLPDGTPIRAADLAASGKEGRDAVRAAMNELATAGYLKRETRSYGRGKLINLAVLSDRPEFISAGQIEDGFPGPDTDASNPQVDGISAGQIEDGLSGPDNPALTTKGPRAKGTKAPPVVPQGGPDTAEVRQVFDAWKASLPPGTQRDLTPSRRKTIGTRLREKGLGDCLLAAVGWRNDPWPDRAEHNDITILFRPSNFERMRDLARNGPPPARENGYRRLSPDERLARDFAALDKLAAEQAARNGHPEGAPT